MDWSWKQSYLEHVAAVKEQESYSCDNGTQWIWVLFTDCISGTRQVTGLSLVGAAAILLAAAGWSSYKASFIVTQSTTLRTPICSLLINTLSLTGALLSMQMVLVIAYDIAAAMVDTVTVFVVAFVEFITRFLCGRNRQQPYKRICDVQTKLTSSPVPTCKVFCFAAVSLTVITMMFVVKVTDSMTKRHEPKTHTHSNFFYTKDSRDQMVHYLLIMIGYALGSVACFTQWVWLDQNWAKELSTNQIIMTPDEEDPTVITTGLLVPLVMTRSVLVLSDVLFVVGVLLQSGGWMVVIVTLPWTVKSSIRACVHGTNICRTLRLHRENKNIKNGDDSDVISITDSGSDTSNILWDKAWKSKEFQNQSAYDLQLKPKARNPAIMKLLNNDTSSYTDWSSTSDEQELEWENETVAPFCPPYKQTQYRVKQLVHSTQPKSIPLTLTIPESCDQRVISWISNSTPEDEKLPSLTMTLNLDPSPPKSADLISIFDEARSAQPMVSPRKYSW